MGTKLGLKGSTAQALQAFKKRNDDARRRVQLLSAQPQTVDFSHYRSILKNQAVVDDIEKQVSGFQVKKYDVGRQINAIEAFEAQAVKSAEETKGKVDAELQDLEKTLKNIETARPFEDLTVVRTSLLFEHMSRDETGLTVFCRTRLWRHAQRSTSVLRSSSPRAAGKCQATRRSLAISQCCRRAVAAAVCCRTTCVYACSPHLPLRCSSRFLSPAISLSQRWQQATIAATTDRAAPLSIYGRVAGPLSGFV